jgi:hypothetical protein
MMMVKQNNDTIRGGIIILLKRKKKLEPQNKYDTSNTYYHHHVNDIWDCDIVLFAGVLHDIHGFFHPINSLYDKTRAHVETKLFVKDNMVRLAMQLDRIPTGEHVVDHRTTHSLSSMFGNDIHIRKRDTGLISPIPRQRETTHESPLAI